MIKFSTQNIREASVNIINCLLDKKYIEVTDKTETIKDVCSVFTNYASIEKRITQETHDTLANNNLSKDYYFKTKKSIAEKNGIEIGDHVLGYLIKQIISMLMYSNYVDEVYAPDHTLQKHMRPFINELLGESKKQDIIIQKQLKHVSENTHSWQIEYQKLKEKINNRSGR